ncbi:MAG: hypothetical protein ABSG84_10025, partial [Acidobacteriaceae bacterium]
GITPEGPAGELESELKIVDVGLGSFRRPNDIKGSGKALPERTTGRSAPCRTLFAGLLPCFRVIPYLIGSSVPCRTHLLGFATLFHDFYI